MNVRATFKTLGVWPVKKTSARMYFRDYTVAVCRDSRNQGIFMTLIKTSASPFSEHLFRHTGAKPYIDCWIMSPKTCINKGLFIDR